MELLLPIDAYFRCDPYAIDMDTASPEEIDALYYDISSDYSHHRRDAEGADRYHFCFLSCKDEAFAITPCYCTYHKGWHLPFHCSDNWS